MSTALFVIVAAAFGWIVNRSDDRPAAPLASPPAADTAAGAQVFETYCASCHTPDAIRTVFGRHADRQRARTELERFLSTHGDAPKEQHRAIVEYVAGGS
jgi:mono/diheme cytochrome c family protein